MVRLCPIIAAFSCLPALSSAVTVPKEVIVSVVEQAVQEYARANGLDAEVSVPHARAVEISGRSPEIRAAVIGRKILGGNASVRVEFRNGDQLLSRAHFAAHVRMFGTVVVAARDIGRGDTLRAADLVVTRVEVGGMSGFFRDTAELAGMRARYVIKSGDVVRSGSVRSMPIVHRDDPVTIRAIAGSVALASDGIAREDGARGELIRVYSTMSRKSVVCRVVDGKTVIAGKEGIQ